MFRVLFLTLVLCLPCWSQLTTVIVTGTVRDGSGNPYAGGSGRAVLVSGNNSGNQNWLVHTTNPVPNPVIIYSLDSFGAFSMSLTTTSAISPASAQPQWRFQFCASDGTTCFSMTPISITAATDISALAQAQAAPLPSPSAGCAPGNCVLRIPSLSQNIVQPPGTSLNITSAGVFTNSQMNENIQSLVNSLSPQTEFQQAQGVIWNSTEAVTGGLAIPSSSGVLTANGVSGYVNNSSMATNGIALYSQCRSLVNGSKCWGANLNVLDTSGLTNDVLLEGLEVDVLPKNPSTAYGGTGGISGISSFIISTQSGNFGGFAFQSLNGGTGLPQWGASFVSNDGVTPVAFSAGLASTSNNSASQETHMQMKDVGGVKHTSVELYTPTGFWRYVLPSGGASGWEFLVDTSVVASINSTGITTAPNFVSNAAIGTQPYATTSTTLNTNLNADMLDGVHSGNISAGHAMCWKDATHMGYCSTVVAADGTCTCN